MGDSMCINLLAEFGDRFQIVFDEAYEPRHVPRDRLDPWFMQLPCQRGCIVPWGGETLAAEVEARPITARRLAACGVCDLCRDGDNEQTYLFELADFETVAAILRPRRRRQVSYSQRAAARERMLAFHRRKVSPERSQHAPQPARTLA